MKATFAVIGGLIAFLGLIWILQGNDFFMYKYFAPKYANAQREVFEGTKSYNQGMIQELQNMQFTYHAAKDSSAKEALASDILHRVADFPDDKLPADLRSFIQKLRDEKSGSKY